jgi:hypothetical protein
MTNATTAFLEQIIASRLPQSRRTEEWRDFLVTWIDLRRMKLNLGAFVPFLVKRSPGPADEAGAERTLQDLIEYARNLSETSPVVFLADANTHPTLIKNPELGEHSIVTLNHEAMQSFLSAKEQGNRYQVLGRAMAECIGPSTLSPYVAGKPASGGRFFGRNKTLEQVVSGKVIRNCTIVGNRRIGKTSLLYEVRDRLSQVYVPNQSIKFASIYASKCKSTWDMVYLIFEGLGVNVPKSLSKFGAIAPRFVTKFPHLVKEHARRTQMQLVILIDEFDSFLEVDRKQNWEFLHLLREAAAEDSGCAVLIAGFRLLMQMRVSLDSPYYNFTREVALTPLHKEETLEMVNVPLSRLGIDLSGSGLATLIHSETRGHPEIIQMYCHAIVSFFEEKKKLPTDGELLSYVNTDPAFNRTILHTFLNNANSWEQSVCLRLMQKAIESSRGVADFEFRPTDVETVLHGMKVSLSNAEMATLLNNLVVGSFIERVKGTPGDYHFAIPQLVRFCQEAGIDQLIETADSQAQKQSLTFEPVAAEGASASRA